MLKIFALWEIELFFFFCIKMDLALNNLQKLICHKPKPPNIIKKHGKLAQKLLNQTRIDRESEPLGIV